MSDWPALLAADRRHVWHPYAPMPGTQAPLPVVAAEGTRLLMADGRQLIDAMSSWWCAVHGHRHPEIVAAMHAQLDTLPHVMFGGLTHEGAIELARTLVALAPGELEHVFFADSGSVSVEVAIKLCLQARPGRTRLLTIRGGYHGDTFGAMAVCDPDGGMHALWKGVLAEHVFADRPPRAHDAGWAQGFADLAEHHANELAAIIVEPCVQGAGGMWFYDPAALQTLRDVADAHGLLLVYDEIATGFGRAGGTLFQGEPAPPDIMCVGKALTGGTMTLAATLCTPAVAAAIDGPVMHGPTFMANPLACAAARASLELLDGWQPRVAAIERGLEAGLAPARDLPGVTDVRVRGAIGVVQLDRPVDVPAATRTAVDRGVWIRPFRDLIYVMPPYVASAAEIDQISGAVVAAAG